MMLGILLRLALAEPHVAFHRQFIGEELPHEQHDDPQVRDLDSDFLEAPREPFRVRREQVHQQDRPQQMPAGKYRRHPPRITGVPDHQPALEPPRLRVPQTLVHLRHRSRKDEHDRDAQHPNREAKRRKKFPDLVHG
jgi:hypothetical protein